ncbi:neutral zinc metallopeptidase [Candidatus Kaiserbacteria bacterium]|nr:neutral zinc metallopeptidase [Candidatus Kaiserbacteria bacterium]
MTRQASGFFNVCMLGVFVLIVSVSAVFAAETQSGMTVKEGQICTVGDDGKETCKQSDTCTKEMQDKGECKPKCPTTQYQTTSGGTVTCHNEVSDTCEKRPGVELCSNEEAKKVIGGDGSTPQQPGAPGAQSGAGPSLSDQTKAAKEARDQAQKELEQAKKDYENRGVRSKIEDALWGESPEAKALREKQEAFDAARDRYATLANEDRLKQIAGAQNAGTVTNPPTNTAGVPGAEGTPSGPSQPPLTVSPYVDGETPIPSSDVELTKSPWADSDSISSSDFFGGSGFRDYVNNTFGSNPLSPSNVPNYGQFSSGFAEQVQGLPGGGVSPTGYEGILGGAQSSANLTVSPYVDSFGGNVPGGYGFNFGSPLASNFDNLSSFGNGGIDHSLFSSESPLQQLADSYRYSNLTPSDLGPPTLYSSFYPDQGIPKEFDPSINFKDVTANPLESQSSGLPGTTLVTPSENFPVSRELLGESVVTAASDRPSTWTGVAETLFGDVGRVMTGEMSAGDLWDKTLKNAGVAWNNAYKSGNLPQIITTAFSGQNNPAITGGPLAAGLGLYPYAQQAAQKISDGLKVAGEFLNSTPFAPTPTIENQEVKQVQQTPETAFGTPSEMASNANRGIADKATAGKVGSQSGGTYTALDAKRDALTLAQKAFDNRSGASRTTDALGGTSPEKAALNNAQLAYQNERQGTLNTAANTQVPGQNIPLAEQKFGTQGTPAAPELERRLNNRLAIADEVLDKQEEYKEAAEQQGLHMESVQQNTNGAILSKQEIPVLPTYREAINKWAETDTTRRSALEKMVQEGKATVDANGTPTYIKTKADIEAYNKLLENENTAISAAKAASQEYQQKLDAIAPAREAYEAAIHKFNANEAAIAQRIEQLASDRVSPSALVHCMQTCANAGTVEYALSRDLSTLSPREQITQQALTQAVQNDFNEFVNQQWALAQKLGTVQDPNNPRGLDTSQVQPIFQALMQQKPGDTISTVPGMEYYNNNVARAGQIVQQLTGAAPMSAQLQKYIDDTLAGGTRADTVSKALGNSLEFLLDHPIPGALLGPGVLLATAIAKPVWDNLADISGNTTLERQFDNLFKSPYDVSVDRIFETANSLSVLAPLPSLGTSLVRAGIARALGPELMNLTERGLAGGILARDLAAYPSAQRLVPEFRPVFAKAEIPSTGEALAFPTRGTPIGASEAEVSSFPQRGVSLTEPPAVRGPGIQDFRATNDSNVFTPFFGDETTGGLKTGVESVAEVSPIPGFTRSARADINDSNIGAITSNTGEVRNVRLSNVEPASGKAAPATTERAFSPTPTQQQAIKAYEDVKAAFSEKFPGQKANDPKALSSPQGNAIDQALADMRAAGVEPMSTGRYQPIAKGTTPTESASPAQGAKLSSAPTAPGTIQKLNNLKTSPLGKVLQRTLLSGQLILTPATNVGATLNMSREALEAALTRGELIALQSGTLEKLGVRVTGTQFRGVTTAEKAALPGAVVERGILTPAQTLTSPEALKFTPSPFTSPRLGETPLVPTTIGGLAEAVKNGVPVPTYVPTSALAQSFATQPSAVTTPSQITFPVTQSVGSVAPSTSATPLTSSAGQGASPGVNAPAPQATPVVPTIWRRLNEAFNPFGFIRSAFGGETPVVSEAKLSAADLNWMQADTLLTERLNNSIIQALEKDATKLQQTLTRPQEFVPQVKIITSVKVVKTGYAPGAGCGTSRGCDDRIEGRLAGRPDIEHPLGWVNPKTNPFAPGDNSLTTLDDVRIARAQGIDIPVTVAGQVGRENTWFLIPEITWRSIRDGQVYTMKNIRAVITDTGSAFNAGTCEKYGTCDQIAHKIDVPTGNFEYVDTYLSRSYVDQDANFVSGSETWEKIEPPTKDMIAQPYTGIDASDIETSSLGGAAAPEASAAQASKPALRPIIVQPARGVTESAKALAQLAINAAKKAFTIETGSVQPTPTPPIDTLVQPVTTLPLGKFSGITTLDAVKAVIAIWQNTRALTGATVPAAKPDLIKIPVTKVADRGPTETIQAVAVQLPIIATNIPGAVIEALAPALSPETQAVIPQIPTELPITITAMDEQPLQLLTGVARLVRMAQLDRMRGNLDTLAKAVAEAGRDLRMAENQRQSLRGMEVAASIRMLTEAAQEVQDRSVAQAQIRNAYQKEIINYNALRRQIISDTQDVHGVSYTIPEIAYTIGELQLNVETYGRKFEVAQTDEERSVLAQYILRTNEVIQEIQATAQRDFAGPPPSAAAPENPAIPSAEDILRSVNITNPTVLENLLPIPFQPLAITLPSNPYGGKIFSQMTREERVRFMQQTTGALNEFWRKVFQNHGKEYTPIRINILPDTDKHLMAYYGSPPGGAPGTSSTLNISINPDVWKSATGFDMDPAAMQLIIAHEMGHYVQDVLGIMNAVNYSFQSLRVELQADFLGGASLRGAGLLYEGAPDQMYKNSLLSSDDVMWAKQESQVKVKPATIFTHPTALERTRAVDLGMRTGVEVSLLTMADLHAIPNWSGIPDIQTASITPAPQLPDLNKTIDIGFALSRVVISTNNVVNAAAKPIQVIGSTVKDIAASIKYNYDFFASGMKIFIEAGPDNTTYPSSKVKSPQASLGTRISNGITQAVKDIKTVTFATAVRILFGAGEVPPVEVVFPKKIPPAKTPVVETASIPGTPLPSPGGTEMVLAGPLPKTGREILEEQRRLQQLLDAYEKAAADVPPELLTSEEEALLAQNFGQVPASESTGLEPLSSDRSLVPTKSPAGELVPMESRTITRTPIRPAAQKPPPIPIPTAVNPMTAAMSAFGGRVVAVVAPGAWWSRFIPQSWWTRGALLVGGGVGVTGYALYTPPGVYTATGEKVPTGTDLATAAGECGPEDLAKVQAIADAGSGTLPPCAKLAKTATPPTETGSIPDDKNPDKTTTIASPGPGPGTPGPGRDSGNVPSGSVGAPSGGAGGGVGGIMRMLQKLFPQLQQLLGLGQTPPGTGTTPATTGTTPPPTTGTVVRFSCDPTTVLNKGITTLSWACNGNERSTGTGFDTGGIPTGSIQHIVDTASSSIQYGVSCGANPVRMCTVNVLHPVITVVAAPGILSSGETSQINWAAVGVKECAVIDSDGREIGRGAAIGSVQTPALTRSTSFAVVCSTDAGKPIYEYAPVIVNGDTTDPVKGPIPYGFMSTTPSGTSNTGTTQGTNNTGTGNTGTNNTNTNNTNTNTQKPPPGTYAATDVNGNTVYLCDPEVEGIEYLDGTYVPAQFTYCLTGGKWNCPTGTAECYPSDYRGEVLK